MSERSDGIRNGIRNGLSNGLSNGLMCALVVAGCLWATYPVAEIGFIDDWSYVKTAQVFAQTGHFVYNGWATAMLGWQVVWGALFIKLFGFSFTVVRLSTLFVAMAVIVLFHAVLVRFGVNARNAVLGTLTLGLSPLFMPMAVSFMTEVPGLFAIVLCLYLCQRAVGAGSDKATIGWLCLAAATNVVGGTARQIAWLGALVMVPSVGWLLRSRRGVLLASSLLWVSSAACVVACLRWFARQPYSVPEHIIVDTGLGVGILIPWFLHQFIGAALCLPLVVFPILVAWLPELRRLDRADRAKVAINAVAFGFVQWMTGWTMPWLFHVINSEFLAEKNGKMFSVDPISLPMWVREAISLLVIVAISVFIRQVRSKWPLIKSTTVPGGSRQEILWLLGPFSVSYLVLLAPRASHAVIFDRYLLPMVLVAIVCLVRLYQQWVAERLPAISFVVLGAFALLGILGTHDWFAWHRAQLRAIDEIRASGVPRTEIQGGFEYDGWTQIEAAGYINDTSIEVPAGAYRRSTDLPRVPRECGLDFAPYTPAIHPRYTVAFGKKWCLAPSTYPPVSYRTWLPPYSGTVWVQEIPGGEVAR